MRALHWINAALWVTNSVVWYAHSTTMAIASFGAAIIFAVVAGRYEP